jgi:hypothetical protein
MSDTLTPRCQLHEVFAGPFIELLTLAPKNPVVRSLILAQTQRLPDPTCVTFEQLKTWVETHCDKRLVTHVAPTGSSATAFALKLDFSETEYGRAHYSVGRSGSADFEVTEAELLALVETAVAEAGGLEHVVTALTTLVDDEAWDRCEPDLDDHGEYSYDDHDMNGTENAAVDYSHTQVRNRLTTYLQQQHPELWEALTCN